METPPPFGYLLLIINQDFTTVELQWLEHLWDHENVFETGVVGVTEGLI